MKLLTHLILIFGLTVGAMASGEYFNNRMLFCLKREAPKLQIVKNGKKGLSIANNKPLNTLLAKYTAVSVRPWLTSADENDVIDGVDLSRIYEVVFNASYNNERLRNMAREFAQLNDVHSADLVPVAKVDGSFQPYIPNDPYFDRQWYLQNIGADKAWKLFGGRTPGDSTVLVGVVDTGFDYLHPDLQDVLYVNPGEDVDHDGKITAADSNGVDDDGNGYVDDFRGWDFVGPRQNQGEMPDNDVRPPNAGYGQILSHGTHVSGVIAAATNNNVGISSISFRSKIIFTKQSYDDDLNQGYLYHGYDGIMYCAKMGAKIINCSWGSTGSSFYEKLVINKVTKDYGAIVVCAAGNDNNDNDDNHHYPSDYDNSIAVAALTRSDVKAYYSNYGDVIDISAPGGQGASYTNAIYSTIHANAGSYVAWQGTSMASPVVAGAFALLKAYFPDSSRNWLVDNLINSADNVDDKNPGYAGQLGSGRVNVFNAIARYLYPSISVQAVRFIRGEDSVGVHPMPGDTLHLELAVQNAEHWHLAKDVRLIVRSSSPAVSFLDSVIQINKIVPGETATNENDDLILVISNQATYEPFNLNFEISANSDEMYFYEEEDQVTVEMSINQNGYPAGSNSVETPLAIADLDKDGQKEVIGVDGQYDCFAYRSDGTMLSGFPVNVESYTTMAPVVADVDNDGYEEIVLVNRKGTLFVISSDGDLLMRKVFDEPVYGNATVANLNDDPRLEIIFGSMRKKLHVVQLDSSKEIEHFPIEVSSAVKYGIAIADINLDGAPEMVFTTSDELLHVMDEAGQEITGFPLTLPDRATQAPVVFMEQGSYRILVSAANDTILKVDASGNVAGEISAGVEISTPMGLCDLNDDGLPEVVFATEDGAVQVFRMDGTAYPGFPMVTEDVFEAAPVFADLDGDQQPEIILNSATGKLFIIKAAGEMYPNFPAVFNIQMRKTAAIADLDADGDLEVAIGSGNGLYAVDINSQTEAVSGWTTYLGNNARTGNYQQSVTAISTSSLSIPEKHRLFHNYPNPFNPSTTIPYQLARTGKVELSIYDIHGRLVHTIINKTQSAGIYRVSWDGSNSQGIKVSSGIYFYRLRVYSPGQSVVQIEKKMLLLK